MNTAVNGLVMVLFLVYVSAVYGAFLYLMLKLDRAIRKRFKRNSIYSYVRQTRKNPGKETVCGSALCIQKMEKLPAYGLILTAAKKLRKILVDGIRSSGLWTA